VQTCALPILLMKTRFAQYPLLPSYWLSSSVLQWAEGALAAAGFFMLVLLSNALFFGFLSFTRMGGMFYDAASTVQSRASVFGQWKSLRLLGQPPNRFVPVIGAAEKLIGSLRWIRPEVRALLV